MQLRGNAFENSVPLLRAYAVRAIAVVVPRDEMSRHNLPVALDVWHRARDLPLPSRSAARSSVRCAQFGPQIGCVSGAALEIRSEFWCPTRFVDQLPNGASGAISSFGPVRGPSFRLVTSIVCDGADCDSGDFPSTFRSRCLTRSRSTLLSCVRLQTARARCGDESAQHIGLYSLSLFHIARMIAASLRARVSCARFGFVPASSIRS